MRTIIMALAVLLTMISCGDNNAEVVANAVSAICSNVVGPEAIHWDLENGIPRTEFPNGVTPTVSNIGGVFSHSQWPLLGFNYPVGWTPEELSGVYTVGVNLYRNDNQAIWRQIAYPTATNATVVSVREFELDAIEGFFNLPNITANDFICERDDVVTTVPGINIAYSNRMFRKGGFTGMVISSLTFGSSIPSPQANVKVAVAPTNEFPTQVFETFLAIEFQFLIRDPDSPLSDRDGDGTPDVYDAEPDNPLAW